MGEGIHAFWGLPRPSWPSKIQGGGKVVFNRETTARMEKERRDPPQKKIGKEEGVVMVDKPPVGVLAGIKLHATDMVQLKSKRKRGHSEEG